MSEIWTMGELLVEIMRPEPDMSLDNQGIFKGPYPSGAPAIFIDTVARMGHTAGIIGAVGDDDFGRCLVNRLKRDNVDCRYVGMIPYLSTAVAFVAYSGDGSRQFIFHIDNTPAVMARVNQNMKFDGSKYFHVMGCSLMANEQFGRSICEAVELFSASGAKISFDPNIRPELLGSRDVMDVAGPVLQHCSVLLPGEKELLLISGQTNIQDAVRKVFDNYPVEIIVLKKARKGSTIYTPQGETEIPVYTVKELDPTGAGDAFDAGFICGLIEALPLEECGRIASAAGALNAAAFGPMEGAISRESIQSMMREAC